MARRRWEGDGVEGSRSNGGRRDGGGVCCASNADDRPRNVRGVVEMGARTSILF